MICRLPHSPKRAPPLLFVHGAWHGAWCWDEHFLGFFAEHGFASYALDLRGRGDNGAGTSLKRVRIRDFVDDVAAAVELLPSPPILVGHSLGGFVVQKYLETASAPLAFLLASVPPWGGRSIFFRSLLRDPLSAILGNLTLSLFPPVSTPHKAKAVLFSPSMCESEAARHQARLQDEALLAYLESLFVVRVRPERVSTPIVVLGGADDAMVERQRGRRNSQRLRRSRRDIRRPRP